MLCENVGEWLRFERHTGPWALTIVLSVAVAASVLGSSTPAYARMGENGITVKVEVVPGETITRFCALGDACGDDGALRGPFEGVWRDGDIVEPGVRTFFNVRLGKVLSTQQFDVYCSAETGFEGCAKIVAGGGGANGTCGGVLNVINATASVCPAGFDYKIEYNKSNASTLTTCAPGVTATCLSSTQALVENGTITSYRALFDYDCVRYCYGGCCR